MFTSVYIDDGKIETMGKTFLPVVLPMDRMSTIGWQLVNLWTPIAIPSDVARLYTRDNYIPLQSPLFSVGSRITYDQKESIERRGIDLKSNFPDFYGGYLDNCYFRATHNNYDIIRKSIIGVPEPHFESSNVTRKNVITILRLERKLSGPGLRSRKKDPRQTAFTYAFWADETDIMTKLLKVV